MKAQLIKVKDLKNNTGQIEGLPKNPRVLKDDKFIKLKKSLEDDPEMLELREVIAYDNNGELIVICGNMRLKALKELGIKEVPTKILPSDTPIEKLKAYTIKDNVSFGDHDWSLLSEWDSEQLEEWGLEVPNSQNENDIYTTKVESPIYEPKEEKPKEENLYNLEKYEDLMIKINNSKLSDKEKLFLQLAATRHIEFNYKNVAEYYAHSEKEVQELMEDSALVIIDYNKAIELGFVKLFETFENLAEIDG
jgi:hypothetical protein